MIKFRISTLGLSLQLVAFLCGTSQAWVSHSRPTNKPMSPLRVSSPPSSDAAAASLTPEEEEFIAKCQTLCGERKLPLEKVKNARDLASVRNSLIKPNRLLRTGRLSDATDADIKVLLHDVNLTTVVDLRSPTELKDDPTLFRPEVFGDFTNVVWKEQGRGRDGCVKEIPPNSSPVQSSRFWKKLNDDHDHNHDGEEATHDDLQKAMLDEKFCVPCSEDPNATPAFQRVFHRKERHFVSIMNEWKYVKGTTSKLRKRDITKAILKSPGALVSRRVRSSIKKPFLDEINDGGLPMLNELLLRFGAPGIKYVLELCSDRSMHPIAFHCTAGKDRTGLITAVILGLCGAEVEDIVEDYSLSANVYAEMNDHKAMVGALSQRSLDPKTFLGAPPHVMREILEAIDEEYGSVQGYCDWIGFGPEKQKALIKACTED